MNPQRRLWIVKHWVGITHTIAVMLSVASLVWLYPAGSELLVFQFLALMFGWWCVLLCSYRLAKAAQTPMSSLKTAAIGMGTLSLLLIGAPGFAGYCISEENDGDWGNWAVLSFLMTTNALTVAWLGEQWGYPQVILSWLAVALFGPALLPGKDRWLVVGNNCKGLFLCAFILGGLWIVAGNMAGIGR